MFFNNKIALYGLIISILFAEYICCLTQTFGLLFKTFVLLTSVMFIFVIIGSGNLLRDSE